MIFSEKQAEENGLRGPFWTPTEKDIKDLEDVLAKTLKESADAQHQQIHQRLDSYKRQYVGVIRAGKRYIRVNCFCGDLKDEDWRTRYVIVKDGGSCYFNFTYDPLNKAISELFLNGEA